MKYRFLPGAAVLLLALVAPLARAAPDKSLAELQQRDRQLFTIGWRLVRGNAPFCTNAAPSLGLLIEDAGAYDDPAKVRKELGLSGDIAVESVAPDSPAAAAEVQDNATLVALNGETVAERFPPTRKKWQRLVDVDAALNAAAAAGPVHLVWSLPDGTTHSATLAGVAACPTRFEVLSHGSKAEADGSRVIIGKNFPAFTYPADELAAVVAHELAHNLLGHRKLLDRLGRTMVRVRLTEREADRLMPWLLANAGYDPEAAVRFMKRWGPRHDGGLFRNRNHDGWDERAEEIAAEAIIVQKLVANTGLADWRLHFRREDVANGKL